MSATETPDKTHSEILPAEVVQVLNVIPEENRITVENFLAKLSFSSIAQSPEAIIAPRINSEHISQTIGLQKKQLDNDFKLQENDYKERRALRWISFAALICVLIFIGIMVLQLVDKDPDTLRFLITAIVSLAAGGVGGYGLGKNQRRQD